MLGRKQPLSGRSNCVKLIFDFLRVFFLNKNKTDRYTRVTKYYKYECPTFIYTCIQRKYESFVLCQTNLIREAACLC